jgi:hypothetical protein
MKLKTASVLIIIAALTIVAMCMPVRAGEKTKPLKINWEKTEWAEKYQVQIIDSEGHVVLETTVTTNQIEFVLPVGTYKIRIAPINIFDKISFWSEWDPFEIRQAKKLEFFRNDYSANAGIKISAGMSYIMLLPAWGGLYYDPYYSYKCIIGFYFGNSRAVKPSAFARYTGIELEGNYTRFKGKNSILMKSDLVNITCGLNFFIKTQLNIPLNFYFGIGAGGSYSNQEYTKYNISAYSLPIRKGHLISFDPYTKVGAGIEFNFLYALSLNIGADFFNIFYRDKFHSSLRYYALVGVRI